MWCSVCVGVCMYDVYLLLTGSVRRCDMCMYVYNYVCVYNTVCVYVMMCVCLYNGVYNYVCVCILTYMCTSDVVVCMSVCVFVCACVRACVHACIHCIM